jgi:ribose-phosphate pyrophosphokinase
MRGQLSIIAGRSNPKFAKEVAKKCGVELTRCEIKTYSDGEINVEICENVRGADVFVIQSTCTPGNDHLMELLIVMDALRRASASRITAVLPYFGYCRQDRKTQPRVPITAKLVADLIVTAGADRVLTMDLHAGQVMGFFNVPVDNLYARPVLLDYFEAHFKSGEVTIVSPDAGGVARARAYAKRIDAGLAIIDKRRTGPNEVGEMKVVGDVEGCRCIIVDDIADTGGTLVKAAEALYENGATDVIACCTHAVLSGEAQKRLVNSRLSKIIFSDTIYHPWVENLSSVEKEKIVCLSVASLFGESITRIHNEDSVSTLFGDD